MATKGLSVEDFAAVTPVEPATDCKAQSSMVDEEEATLYDRLAISALGDSSMSGMAEGVEGKKAAVGCCVRRS